jgi:hypothetical protein
VDAVPFVFARGRVLIDRRFRFHNELLYAVRADRGRDAFDAWINEQHAQLGIARIEGGRLVSFELNEFVPRPFRMRDEALVSQEEWEQDEESQRVLADCERALIEALHPR